MRSVYRRFKDLEKKRYDESLPLINAGKEKGIPPKFYEVKQEYDRKEIQIIDECRRSNPLFEKMLIESDYLEKMQRKYGSLTWLSGDRVERKKLNTEFEEVLGMRPLAPSYIPLFGSLYRKTVSRNRLKFISDVIICCENSR